MSEMKTILEEGLTGDDTVAFIEDEKIYEVKELHGYPVDKEAVKKCAFLQHSDTDNARRLALHFGNDLFHIRSIGWGAWDGKRIDTARGDELSRTMAQATAYRIALENQHLKKMKGEEEKDLNKRKTSRRSFSVTSRNAGRVDNMLKMHAPHCALAPDEMDVDGYLFNVQNGTLQFSRDNGGSVALRPHNVNDKITKISPTSYNPEAECPRFMAFLQRVQPDVYVRDFLQTWHGLCLLGINEQYFVFNYGEGANGKSTFMELISRIMGDYCVTIQAQSVTGMSERRGDQATPDLATLPGARMVRIQELPRGEQLKESLVKTLTGGEAITVRHLHGKFFDFYPICKPIMSGNDYPRISGVDEGIWRRILDILWPVRIPVEERRPIETILAEFKEEYEGIMAWLVNGALQYLRTGLIIPDSVRQETERHRSGADPVQVFIDMKIKKTPDEQEKKVQARHLYKSYEEACPRFELGKPYTEKYFAGIMEKKGFAKSKTRIGVVYTGIELLPDPVDD